MFAGAEPPMVKMPGHRVRPTPPQSAASRALVAGLALILFENALFGATLQLTDAQLIDRIKGGWMAKGAANSLGQPYEGAGPDESRTLAASFGGGNYSIIRCNDDDTYCPMPFLLTMDSLKTGAGGIYTATMQDYADAFEKTTFPIYCANAAAMAALKSGISAPYSGGWPLNGKVMNGYGCSCPASEGQGFSFYSQWIGFVTPGLPATCVKIDSITAHVIVYANGLYATMYYDVACAIAPLYTNVHTIITEARRALPQQCDIGRNIDSLVWYHDNNPAATYWDAMNWAFGVSGQSTGHLIAADGENGSRVNSAIVTIALLWGDNDMMATTLYAARMGQDADCNCGDAGAILGSMLGYQNLPPDWKTAYESMTADSAGCAYSGIGSTGWNFVRVVDSSIAIAKQCILQSGGSYANGVYTIPVQDIPAPKWFEEYGKDPVPFDSNAVQARISASPLHGAAPLACSLSAAASYGRSLRYLWNFGDGSPADTHVALLHVFQNVGTYAVKLTVGNGVNVDSTALSITANNPFDSITYEAEELTRASIAGKTTYVSSEAANSNGAAVMITDNTPVVGDWVEFTLGVAATGDYHVAFFGKTNTNRGTLQASVDGSDLGAPSDEYGAVAYQVPFDLGLIHLAAGTHTIRFTVTGKNAASTGYNVHIDKIVLTPSGVTFARGAASRVGAMPPLNVRCARNGDLVVRLSHSSAQPSSIDIWDAAGRKIWETHHAAASTVLGAGTLARGLYLVAITQGGARTVQTTLVSIW